MKPHIDPKMVLEHGEVFGGVPGTAKEAVDICSHHGEGVINGKKWVVFDAFELSLTGDACPNGFVFMMKPAF